MSLLHNGYSKVLKPIAWWIISSRTWCVPTLKRGKAVVASACLRTFSQTFYAMQYSASSMY